MIYNPCINTDSYKIGMNSMQPDKMTYNGSYMEARGGDWGEMTFFGLQYYILNYLMTVPTIDQIQQAKWFWKQHLGSDVFDHAGWNEINQLGYLPLEIRAIPEGTSVPHGNIFMWIENTDPDFAWLVRPYETLLTKIWYPSAVATLSRGIKKGLLTSLQNCTDLDEAEIKAKLMFMLHDFGARSATSEEAAMLGGMGHLVNFYGTDTAVAIQGILDNYHSCEEFPAYSVAASEHSIMTIGGPDGESEVVGRLLDRFPKGILSIVADSYDIYNFVKNIIGKQYKEKIIARDGVVVIRPDSGDPEVVVVEVLEMLGEAFGFTTNSKAMKVLPACIRVIQGDGINAGSIGTILFKMKLKGWSPENIVFGMGTKLLQDVNRDTHKIATKCSSAIVDNKSIEVFKNPVTAKWKASKKGRLDLIDEGAKCFHTIQRDGESGKGYENVPSALVPVFRDGKILRKYSFDEVRANAAL